jgi:hypothetical protein
VINWSYGAEEPRAAARTASIAYELIDHPRTTTAPTPRVAVSTLQHDQQKSNPA